MSEHRMTDQTATTIALHGLINDMHHALDRIAFAEFLLSILSFVGAAFSAVDGDWVRAAMRLGFGGVIFLGYLDTSKRKRKYRPARAALVAAKGNDEEGL